MIEVFADIWCPFTHVGLANLVSEVRGRGHNIDIYVRSWPLEWVNGRPMDPRSALGHAHELRAQVAPDSFASLDPATFPRSTIPVLALVARAYGLGPDAGLALSLEVRHRLFEQGRDVSDPDSIAELASWAGTDPPEPDDYAAVVADWAEGRRRGVKGSPHFFCGTQAMFCPSLDITDADAGGKEVRPNMARLREFLEGCLAG